MQPQYYSYQAIFITIKIYTLYGMGHAVSQYNNEKY